MPSSAVAAASTAAQRLHARLGTDYDKPVDIFRIVQDEGIWLASRPLSGALYGFYLRQGAAAGIVVNSDHPEPLQRYTCAHELGHHVLGHQSHLDEPDDVRGPAGNRANEVAAQAFAGALLMPLQAVNRVMRRLGMTKSRRLDAADIYAISRELDVSFTAAAWQLAALGRIPTQDAARWARQGAAAVKNAMRPGPPPEGDNRAALYIIDPSNRDVPILCRPGDELRLRLPENASTGHVWRITSPSMPQSGRPILSWDGRDGVDRALIPSGRGVSASGSTDSSDGLLRLAQDNYLPAPIPSGQDQRGGTASSIGRSGIRELVFLVDRPGRAAVSGNLSRPWESRTIDNFTTPVRIGPTHVLDGFAHEQARAHAARVAEG